MLILGAVAGLVMGLTGAGGSLLAIPLLMWTLGWTLPQATPVALLSVCLAATFSTVTGWRRSYVRYRAAAMMAAASLLTAPLGLYLAHWLPLPLLTLIFAALLIALALRLWRQTRGADADANTHLGWCRLDPEDGRILWTRSCVLAFAATGALSGFLAGLLGIGSFIVVTAIRSFSDLSMHCIIATSLMATALISGATVCIVLIAGRTLPWATAAPFALGALFGILLGRNFAYRLAGLRLQQTFASLMLLVGLSLAVQVALTS